MPLKVSVSLQKYTVSSDTSGATAPLYIKIQVYNPTTNIGVPGVSVTLNISVNGGPSTPRTFVTGVGGVVKLCPSSSYAVSANLVIGYDPVDFLGTHVAGNPNVPISVSQGVPSFCP
jgi:hypothetical protein